MATKVTDLTELTVTPDNDDVLHIVDIDDTTGGAAGTSKKIKVSTLPGGGGGSGTVTSVALAVPSALSVSGSPVTTAGTITISGAGTSAEYIDGTGALQTTSTGTVTGVTGTAPITSSGGAAPAIGITAATTSAAGSMSSADKTKLDGIDGNVLDGQIIEYTTRSSAFANGSFEGEVLKYGAGTLVETKAYVYGSSAWTAVDADSEAKTKGLFGIALGTSGLVSGLLVRGVMQHTSWSGFAIGEILYVSTTEGLITNTAPSATGDFVRVIGYALGNSYIFVDASGTYIEIA